MIFTKKKRLVALLLWFSFLGAVYWGFGGTALTMPITVGYFVLCLLLSVLYILVNGGITPILQEDAEREARTREKYLADKGKMHPIKRRDKYRRFTVGKRERVPVEKTPIFRPNLLHIPEEKRVPLSQILLVLLIPFYLIFILDWIILAIFF
ncbi:MAG: hypothetical protein IJC84_04835 [Clostridia bacterium]|nr:hypothetical protein [Clostridia bacterium]